MLNALLDASVVFSFDRSGYRRHARRFTDPEPDLRGQVVAVTGANQGLGYATARRLVGWGAEVWIVARSAERGRAAVDRLGAPERVRLALADLGELDEVDRLADALPPRLDALVHNAGALLDAPETTRGGLERTWATHVVGPVRLTLRVADRLAGGRLVWVSSGGMYTQRLRVDRLGATAGYNGVVAYAQAKRAQVVLAAQLAERLPDVWVAAMHPGWADTKGVQTALPTFHRLTRGILRDADAGADTIAWLAAARRGPSGRFWFDRAEVSPHAFPWTRESAADREALWAKVMADAG